MNCQDNSRLKVPLPEVCNTTDIGCVPLTSGKPRCAPEPDQLPLAYDPGDGTLWVFQCDTRQWISLGGSFSLSDLDEVNLDNITNICNILKIPVFYNPGVGTIQGSVSLAEFSEQLLKCVRLERRVAILADGKVEFSVPGINGLDPVYVKYEGLTVSGEGSASNPLVVKAEAPPQESPCSYPEKTQAQVDAATSVKIIACVDNEKARIPYPEGESVCSAPRRTLAQALAAGEKDLIACIDGIVVRIPLNEILDYTGDDTMDGICGFPMTTLANLPDNTTIAVCANSQSYLFKPDPVVFNGIPAVTIGAPSGNTPPAPGQVPFRTDGTTLWVWNGDTWVAFTPGGADPGADYLLRSEAAATYETQAHAGDTYETKVHAEATYAKKTDIPDIPDPQDLSAYLKKTDASRTYLKISDFKKFADNVTGNYNEDAFVAQYGTANRSLFLNLDTVTPCGASDACGIITYAYHNRTFLNGTGSLGTPTSGTIREASTYQTTVTNDLGVPATVVATPWVNMVENTSLNPKYYFTGLCIVTTNGSATDEDLIRGTTDNRYAGPIASHAVLSSSQLVTTPAYFYGSGNQLRNGTTFSAPKGVSVNLEAGATVTLYLRMYCTIFWPDKNDFQVTTGWNRTICGGAKINIYAA